MRLADGSVASVSIVNNSISWQRSLRGRPGTAEPRQRVRDLPMRR
jgi:hypothetical protein